MRHRAGPYLRRLHVSPKPQLRKLVCDCLEWESQALIEFLNSRDTAAGIKHLCILLLTLHYGAFPCAMRSSSYFSALSLSHMARLQFPAVHPSRPCHSCPVSWNSYGHLLSGIREHDHCHPPRPGQGPRAGADDVLSRRNILDSD
ncbi:uncharacterized protein LAESUDRAFT_326799 [Laetiporus sulphureus 93-53]|uniref:Uncharacterized protein n=1 Tax=Laetiporus sulphureus 93-53 TaxID=1314785 RepID=A0A165CZM1_9APHY|nr:uncharacterized protein LAESUDRAFT_326799 [Laetiporus sulphureus 93-53]KZT03829.1 hypothetical protein LAESUDRAFT_326799 [Laetiporus sulphureus 93-53]